MYVYLSGFYTKRYYTFWYKNQTDFILNSKRLHKLFKASSSLESYFIKVQDKNPASIKPKF